MDVQIFDQENQLLAKDDKIALMVTELDDARQKIEELSEKISFSDNKLYRTELDK